MKENVSISLEDMEMKENIIFQVVNVDICCYEGDKKGDYIVVEVIPKH